MHSPFTEKVLLPEDHNGSALEFAPADVARPNGAAAGQSTRESRSQAEAARQPRWGPKSNILDTLATAGRFKTLGRALEDTYLAEILNEKGPFTLFAPTDEAFAKMPSDDLSSLLTDNVKLRAVLSRHIVAQKVRAPRERVPNTVTAIDGRKVTMSVTQGYYRVGAASVGDAQIVKTNLRASNGVIHAIDSVLLQR